MDSSPFTVDELKRYSRQIFLPEIGYEGQAKLKRATVLIIGLGGLGSPSSLYLSASGIGKLILVDDDVVELSNLQRQIIHRTQHIQTTKTTSAKTLLGELNPNTEIESINSKLNPHTGNALIEKADLIMDCSDNFTTRYLVNQLCIEHKKPLISASVIAFQGQLCCFDFRQTDSACYACLFPHHESNEKNAANCSEVGVFATAAGIMGIMQANEALKTLIGLSTLHNRLLLLDTLNLQQRIVKIKIDSNCQYCHT